MRKYYLDNLRWINILLLFPYHTCMIYNNWGENFYVKSKNVALLSDFIRICYPWFMPLMFVIAGISSCYALDRRTPRQYIKERLLKLFLPMVAGILLIIPLQTYYAEKYHNGYTGGYFQQYELFFTKVTDLTGYTGGFTPAQLWFILYLFIISLLALPVMLMYKKSTRKLPLEKLSMPYILTMFLIFLIMTPILEIGGKSLGAFFALFMLGFLVLSEDSIQAKLDKYRWHLFASSAALTVLNLLLENLWHSDYGLAYDIFTRLLTWVCVLSILGMGRHYLNFRNKATDYFSKASFPIYIFHQSMLVFVAYYTLKITSSLFLQVIMIISGSFVMTLLTYEIFKRVSFTRFLFGIKE